MVGAAVTVAVASAVGGAVGGVYSPVAKTTIVVIRPW